MKIALNGPHKNLESPSRCFWLSLKTTSHKKPPQVLIDILLILSTAKLQSLQQISELWLPIKVSIHKKCISWLTPKKSFLFSRGVCRSLSNVKQFERRGFNRVLKIFYFICQLKSLGTCICIITDSSHSFAVKSINKFSHLNEAEKEIMP